MLTHEQAKVFYDRFGAKQDSQAFYEEAALTDLIEHADFDEAGMVFEFGSGTGRLAERVLEHHLPLSTCYRGVDISDTMVKLSTERLERFNERARVTQSDGSMEIPAPEGTIDRIVSTYVLDLLPESDIRAFLDDARRALTWDGRLCLAGLTYGPTPTSKTVIAAWNLVHTFRPSIVGGCRPIRMLDFLPEQDWTILHHRVLVASAVPSEVLIATPRSRPAIADVA